MVTFLRDPNRGFRLWLIAELYTGPNGTGAMVPNVNDAVLDWGNDGMQRVLSVDEVTALHVLGPATDIAMTGVADGDVFIGNGGGHVSETYRLNIDKSVVPFRASLHSSLRIHGSSNAGVKLFYGVDTSKDTGRVISAYYNQSGELVGDMIPLELVATDNIDNVSIQTTVTGSVTYDLNDGELVTGVVYDNVGKAISEFRLLVRNNTFIYARATSTRYITGIYLRSNFMSTTDDRTLLFPVNVPVADIEIFAVVKYSDDTEQQMPITGNKIALHGLEDFVSSTAGQSIPLTLTYRLDDNESSTVAAGGVSRHITEIFNVTSIPMDGAYAVKLFIVPTWIDIATGYQLRYYLFNIDGTRRMDVTDFVQHADGTATYLPKAYGAEQRLDVVLELNDAVPGLGAYRHVQSFAVTLQSPAYEESTPWTISYTPGIPDVYGIGLVGRMSTDNANVTSIDFSSGAISQAEWLNRMYYDAKPLYGGADMPTPRVPSHYEVAIGAQVIRLPIADWNTPFVVPEGITVAAGDTLLFRWVLETPQDDVWLAASGLVLRV